MKAAGSRGLMLVFEYGARSDDSMMSDLRKALQSMHPNLRVDYVHGFLKRYIPGGTRPLRLLNLCFVYAVIPFAFALRRPGLAFVRTTPPGVQMWAVFWGWILRVPVGVWLMDYHPEIEARWLESKGWPKIFPRLLRGVDAFCLRKAHSVVALDQAMAALVAERCPQVPLVVHPTWSNRPGAAMPRRPERVGKCLNIIYAGNLGASHPLDGFEALLREMAAGSDIRLFGVGLSPAGERRFSLMAGRLGLPLNFASRLPFSQLGEFFESNQIHLGVVLLSDATAGLVSPSKFAAYLEYGVPTLYVGPKGTNADMVCEAFKAGFCLRNGASPKEVRALADLLAEPGAVAAAASHVPSAAAFFGSRNGETLARALQPIWFGSSLG